MKTRSIIFIILILLFALVGLYVLTSLLYNLYLDGSVNVVTNIQEQDDIVEACNNLTLSETAGCLSENVKTFFYYNQSNIGRMLTFDEVKEQGGVCNHYTEIYKYAFEKLGFKTKTIDIFPQDNAIGHTFLVAFNDDGYCILDQNVDPICLKIIKQ